MVSEGAVCNVSGVYSCIESAPSSLREIRQEKEKQRIIRTGRNKFNSNPKEVCVM